jgi:hypothetical protein
VLTAAFLDYVQARGIFVDPARIRAPKDKPRVENQVPYVRESWFDGESFGGLDDARASAEVWCRDVAGSRVHGTTRKVPREMFESVEKPVMHAAPDALYDVPIWVEDAKVHPDHHIEVARALYSVPHPYLRKHVRVRVDRKLVKIYFGTQLIKMHERQPPGGRSTDAADYPPHKSIYALRDVDALRARARERGAHVGLYAERLLGGPLPWTRMRQAYALVALCDKYGDGRVEAICPERPRVRRRLRPQDRQDAQIGGQARAPRPGRRQARAASAAALRAPARAVRDARRRRRRDALHYHAEQGGRLMAASTPLNPELAAALKRLRLGRVTATLHERLILADKQDMPFEDVLLMILTDEIARRDNAAADNRAHEAGLDPTMRLELWEQERQGLLRQARAQ